VGLDISAVHLSQAFKVHRRAAFVVGDAHRIPFHDSTFDLVVSVGVLEHVADFRRVVEEMVRVSKKDSIGIMVFYGPNRRIGLDSPVHRRQVTHYLAPSDAIGVFDTLGFTVDKVWHTVVTRKVQVYGISPGSDTPYNVIIAAAWHLLGLMKMRSLVPRLARILETLGLEWNVALFAKRRQVAPLD
jgi:SAM-dependent methyltransferase